METHHEHIREGAPKRRPTKAEELAQRAVLLEKLLIDTNHAAQNRRGPRSQAAFDRDLDMAIDHMATTAALLRELTQELVSTNGGLQILFNDRI